MGVVLPGETHAAEHLDAPLGRLDVGVEGDGPGQGGRQAAWSASALSVATAASHARAVTCSTDTTCRPGGA